MQVTTKVVITFDLSKDTEAYSEFCRTEDLSKWKVCQTATMVSYSIEETVRSEPE